LGPEEIDLRAEPENEVVVPDRRQLVEANLSRVEVDIRHLRVMDNGVALVPHQVTEGMADRRLLEQTRRQLIEQRLKGVVIVTVDQHNLDLGVLQLLRSPHTG